MIFPERKHEGITEYMLYLWHVEDLIRTLNFEFKEIKGRIIDTMPAEAAAKESSAVWFKKVMDEMKKNKLQEKGHIEEAEEILAELFYLHNLLLNVLQDKFYTKAFEQASPNIKSLQSRSTNTSVNPVEICLTGIYGVLHLKMQSKGISKETEEAVKSFTDLLNMLSKRYRDMKSGKLDFSQVQKN